MGGDNSNWESTALDVLYKTHEKTSSDPVGAAGKDGSWILKKLINEEDRNFETKKEDMIRKYRWV